MRSLRLSWILQDERMMLLRRYGSSVQSVVPNFDSNALNEIGFRRDRSRSFGSKEFEEQYERVRDELIVGEVEGPVQSEAEAALLARIESELRTILDQLEEGEVLLVESQQGVDYPKLKDRKEGIIVGGENRLYFHWRVDPPLRLGLYRPREH